MKQLKAGLPLVLLLAALCWPCAAQAQNPTAIQRIQLSAFGGASGVFTGLGGGKNASLTVGVDLGLPPFHGILRPTLEVRGTYPIDKGIITAQKSVMGGLRVDFLLGHRFHPYADFLFGRGESHYGTGYFFRNFEYELTTTYVYSPGAGIDYDLGHHVGVKLDGQYQRWGYAPTDSGTIYSKVGTVGLVYVFDFNGHRRR